MSKKMEAEVPLASQAVQLDYASAASYATRISLISGMVGYALNPQGYGAAVMMRPMSAQKLVDKTYDNVMEIRGKKKTINIKAGVNTGTMVSAPSVAQLGMKSVYQGIRERFTGNAKVARDPLTAYIEETTELISLNYDDGSEAAIVLTQVNPEEGFATRMFNRGISLFKT